MKIGCLGAGAWGFCLAHLLAENGHDIVLWTRKNSLALLLENGKAHPKLPKLTLLPNMRMTTNLAEAITNVELVMESVTAKGAREVFQAIAQKGLNCPLIITSKGIEQNTLLLLSEVFLEVFGKSSQGLVGSLSGPSLANEVMDKLPTSVVCSAYDDFVLKQIQTAFASPYFRVYPNKDVAGCAFGGAMKNVMAIACGIAQGMGFGENTRAALITRGLHEIRKLSVAKNAFAETLNGLAGLGDLCATCFSPDSRNHKFGMLIANGYTASSAKEKIGMVVEGTYTVSAAHQLALQAKIPAPITEGVYRVLYEDFDPRRVVSDLLSRPIKQEHL